MLEYAAREPPDLVLTPEEERMLAGDDGEAVKWAIAMQIEVGRFFGADSLVPVSCVH